MAQDFKCKCEYKYECKYEYKCKCNGKCECKRECKCVKIKHEDKKYSTIDNDGVKRSQNANATNDCLSKQRHYFDDITTSTQVTSLACLQGRTVATKFLEKPSFYNKFYKRQGSKLCLNYASRISSRGSLPAEHGTGRDFSTAVEADVGMTMVR
eukprot:jgi/Psemu1/8825/gm1.8825_g